MGDKLAKFDKVHWGIISGLSLTILRFFISYPILTNGIQDMTMSRYFNYMFNGVDKQNVMIFCLLPNMFLFYLVNFRWRMVEFTKGLVGVTFLFAIALIFYTVY